MAPSVGRTFLVLMLFAIGCESSLEQHVDAIATGEADDAAKMAVYLAKDRAVDPLLRTIEQAPDSDVRKDIVRILGSLTLRTGDGRIDSVLTELLVTDEDPSVRVLVAEQLGLHRRSGTIPGLMRALDDSVGDFRRAALVSLSVLEPRWGANRSEMMAQVRDLAFDSHEGTRVEALILRSGEVQARLKLAQQATLSGDVDRADSLMQAILEYAPGDKRAAYELGFLYLRNAREYEGQQVLRTHGMLLDVGRLSNPPTIDGLVSSGEWTEAAHTDSFWQLSSQHEAALPTDLRTELWVGWRAEGVYVAVRCWDDAPDSLVILATEDDNNTGGVWQEDRVGFFWDADMEPTEYVQHAVNPAGIHTDALYTQHEMGGDPEWDIDGEWAAVIEDSLWSVELLMRFDDQNPRPNPGDMWSANFFRSYRGSEFVQWTRTSRHTMRPDQMGVLLFDD